MKWKQQTFGFTDLAAFIKRRSIHYYKILVFMGLIFTYHIYTVVTKPLPFTFVATESDSHCILPELDPFDDSLKHLLSHPDPVTCDGGPALVSLNDFGVLRINETAAKAASISNFNCSYQLFNRVGDDEVKLGVAHQIQKPIYVNGDIFLVTCHDGKRDKIYERVHYTIDHKRVKKSKVLRSENKDDLSVLIFLIDSVSRLAAERHLPKTMKYIREKLGAFVFRGHSVLAEYSFRNAMGLLTGLEEPEVQTMGTPDGWFDDVPMIWKDFSKKGYATEWAEDYTAHSTLRPWLGKTFPNHGFKVPPTDHYMRPFYLAVEKLHPLGFYLDYARIFLQDKAKSLSLKGSSPFCYGNLPRHKHMMEFYRRFIQSYKGKLKFGISWLNELAHDFSSYLELADEDLLLFFKWLKRDGHLDNTMFLLVSDHGSRVGKVRNTKVGRVEFKMPLLSVILPNKFKQRYPHIAKNLKDNTKKLTSPFDVYRTLQDVLNKTFSKTYDSDNNYQKLNSRGISLFKRIPANRNCLQCGIPESFCPCYVTQDAVRTDPEVQEVSNFVVQEINNALKPVSDQCAQYQLSSIIEAQYVLPKYQKFEVVNSNSFWSWFSSSRIKPEENKRYTVLIQTSPGDAIFEATVDKISKGSFELLGHIIRNSKYGNTSKCMRVKYLRELCLCNEFVNT